MLAQLMTVPSREQVVAAIYETVLRDELFDRFHEAQYGTSPEFGATAAKGPSAAFAAPELQAHFARALEILEQQWNRDGRPGPLSAGGRSKAGGAARTSNPNLPGQSRWAIFSPDGSIQHQSPGFLEIMALPQPWAREVLRRLQVCPEGLRIWQDLMQRVQRASSNGQQVCLLKNSATDQIVLCRPIWTGQDGSPVSIMLEVHGFSCGQGIEAFLQETFKLDPTEVRELLTFLQQGSQSEPKRPLGRQPQFDALQEIAARVGAPGIAELVRLVCFLTQEHARDLAIAEGRRLPPSQILEHNDTCTQVFRMGAETGQPVIFAHGIMDGIAGMQRLQPELRQAGFRIYAPLRGGYGASGPAPSNGRQLEAFVDQVRALCTAENLQKPILMGHRSGSIFVRAAALRLRDRVGGVLGVAPAHPFNRIRSYGLLQGHQRALALAAQYAPKLLPLILQSWSRSVRRKGAGTLMRRQVKRDSRTMGQFNRLDLDQVLALSHQLTMEQNGAGLEVDLKLLTRDWRRDVRGGISPAIFLCGEGEAKSALDGLFSQMGERAQLRFYEGLGAVLLYLAPELVVSALEELSNQS